MKEYLLIIALELAGISLHVLQKVLELDKKSPDDSLSEVFGLFWKSDRITVFISFVVLFLNVIGHYIIEEYGPEAITNHEYYDLTSFAVALILGYAGQRLIYKWLGKAEAKLENNKILN